MLILPMESVSVTIRMYEFDLFPRTRCTRYNLM